MGIQWFEGKIVQISDLTSMTRSLLVEIITDLTFEFLPGQFITLDLPIGDKRLQRWRSYSIASRPCNDNLIELCIALNPKGLGSKYIFDLAVGNVIKFKGPDGGFVLPGDLTKEIIMVCTGTGVAPFKSMVDHIMSQQLDFCKIHLIFGTRTSDDLLYYDHFREIAAGDTRFNYDVSLSKEANPNTHFGYVHKVYEHYYSQMSENRIFMLCGWSDMIDMAVEKLIIDLKYKPNQVKYELYG